MKLTVRQTRLLTYVVMSVPMVIAADFFSRTAASTEFYSTVAQVIAAMYLAVAIEYFTAPRAELGWIDRIEFIVLLAASWIGVLACLRALAGKPESWTAGLAGMGLIAAVLLVTSGLAHRLSKRDPKLVGLILSVVCLVPLVVFLVPVPK